MSFRARRLFHYPSVLRSFLHGPRENTSFTATHRFGQVWRQYSSDAQSELVKLLSTCQEQLRETKKIYAKEFIRFDEMEAIFLDIDQGGDNMFADDSSEFMHEYNNLQKSVSESDRLSSLFNEQKELVELILEEGESDVELWRQCKDQLEIVLDSCERMYIESKMTEEEDNCSSIFLEVNSGAGGDDANDWRRCC